MRQGAVDDRLVQSIGARIDRMPFSPWHVRLTAIIGSANFFDALDATALAFVLPLLVTLWKLTPTEAGLLISASYAGQLVGAVAAGVLAERIGRTKTLGLCLVLISVVSLGCAAAPSYLVLFVLRLIQGVGLGGEVPIAATYMNEVCPARFRGRAIVAIQLMFNIGMTAASLLALFLIPEFGWRSMFVIGSLPILVALALRLFVPESPRWLAAKGHSAMAEAATASIERKVYGSAVPEVIGKSAPYQTSAALAGNGFGRLIAPGQLRSTLSAWIVAFCASTIVFAIVGWMPTIYQTVYHLPVKTALNYSAMTGMLSLVGAVLTIMIIDRTGRKTSVLLGFGGGGCFLAFVAVAGLSLDPFVVALAVSGALLLVGMPVAIVYVYSPEIYPTHIRAFGTGVASSWLRVAAIIAPPMVGFILTLGGIRSVFVFLTVVAVVGALGMAWLGIETRPRPAGGHDRSSKTPLRRTVPSDL